MKAKRILSLLTVFAMMLTLFAVPASAAAAGTFVVNASDVKAGQDVEVKINAVIPTAGFNVEVSYPADKLTYKSSTAMDANTTVTDDGEGKIVIGYANPAGADVNADAATIIFTACDEAALGEASSAEAEIGITYCLTRRGAIDVYDKGGVNYAEEALSFTGKTITIKKAHTAPTFDVAIDETAPTSGDTLTATVSNFVDNWDLTPVYAYEWYADTAVVGAGETYAVKADDFGKAISVKVTATVASDDEATNTVTVTSAATDAVDVPEIAPILSVATTRDDTVAVGTEIKANASASSVALVGGTNAITYSWKVNGVEVGTAASYTVAVDDYANGEEYLTCDVVATNSRNGLTASVTITFTNAIVAGNMPPVVSNVALTNVADDAAVVGATVKATYSFTDVADVTNTPENLDGGVKVTWYIDDTAIATGEELVIDKKWIGNAIVVVFTPWSNDGTANEVLGYEENDADLLEGASETLSFSVEPDLNTAPVVSDVVILGGSINLETAFTVSYKVFDINGFAPNANIALYKAADDSAVDANAYVVDGNKVTITDATLENVEVYVKVTPVDPEGYTYTAALVGVDSAKAVVGPKPKASSGNGGMTGPMLGGGGSSKPATTPTPSTQPTEEPKEEPTTEPTEAPVTVPAAKDCITLTIGKTDINVFGEAATNDVAPVIRNDRTMLPARIVAEALGATVAWDGDARVVTITKGDVTIVITIDADKAIVNGEEIALDSAAFIESDRTYLPMRFLGEKLGAEVTWNGATQEVYIVPAK